VGPQARQQRQRRDLGREDLACVDNHRLLCSNLKLVVGEAKWLWVLLCRNQDCTVSVASFSRHALVMHSESRVPSRGSGGDDERPANKEALFRACPGLIDENGEILDERLKGIEPKLIETIAYEILDRSPAVTWDDIGRVGRCGERMA